MRQSVFNLSQHPWTPRCAPTSCTLAAPLFPHRGAHSVEPQGRPSPASTHIELTSPCHKPQTKQDERGIVFPFAPFHNFAKQSDSLHSPSSFDFYLIIAQRADITLASDIPPPLQTSKHARRGKFVALCKQTEGGTHTQLARPPPSPICYRSLNGGPLFDLGLDLFGESYLCNDYCQLSRTPNLGQYQHVQAG